MSAADSPYARGLVHSGSTSRRSSGSDFGRDIETAHGVSITEAFQLDEDRQSMEPQIWQRDDLTYEDCEVELASAPDGAFFVIRGARQTQKLIYKYSGALQAVAILQDDYGSARLENSTRWFQDTAALIRFYGGRSKQAAQDLPVRLQVQGQEPQLKRTLSFTASTVAPTTTFDEQPSLKPSQQRHFAGRCTEAEAILWLGTPNPEGDFVFHIPLEDTKQLVAVFLDGGKITQKHVQGRLSLPGDPVSCADISELIGRLVGTASESNSGTSSGRTQREEHNGEHWFYVSLSQQKAVKELQDAHVGCFMVRQRQTTPVTYGLDFMAADKSVHHRLIQTSRGGFHLSGSSKIFPSLRQMIVSFTEKMDSSVGTKLVFSEEWKPSIQARRKPALSGSLKALKSRQMEKRSRRSSAISTDDVQAALNGNGVPLSQRNTQEAGNISGDEELPSDETSPPGRLSRGGSRHSSTPNLSVADISDEIERHALSMSNPDLSNTGLPSASATRQSQLITSEALMQQLDELARERGEDNEADADDEDDAWETQSRTHGPREPAQTRVTTPVLTAVGSPINQQKIPTKHHHHEAPTAQPRPPRLPFGWYQIGVWPTENAVQHLIGQAPGTFVVRSRPGNESWHPRRSHLELILSYVGPLGDICEQVIVIRPGNHGPPAAYLQNGTRQFGSLASLLDWHRSSPGILRCCLIVPRRSLGGSYESSWCQIGVRKSHALATLSFAPSGAFVVRSSETLPDKLVLSFVYAQRIFHELITVTPGTQRMPASFTLDVVGHRSFHNVHELVTYFWRTDAEFLAPLIFPEQWRRRKPTYETWASRMYPNYRAGDSHPRRVREPRPVPRPAHHSTHHHTRSVPSRARRAVPGEGPRPSRRPMPVSARPFRDPQPPRQRHAPPRRWQKPRRMAPAHQQPRQDGRLPTYRVGPPQQRQHRFTEVGQSRAMDNRALAAHWCRLDLNRSHALGLLRRSVPGDFILYGPKRGTDVVAMLAFVCFEGLVCTAPVRETHRGLLRLSNSRLLHSSLSHLIMHYRLDDDGELPCPLRL